MTIPLPSRRFTLVSPYTPDQCTSRLHEAVVSLQGWAWIYAWLSRKPLSGEVDHSGIRVRIHAHQRWALLLHPLQLQLAATLEPQGDGTRLFCCITRSFARSITSLCLAGSVFLIGVYCALIWFVKVSSGESIWGMWWASPLLLMSCYFLWLYPRSAYREGVVLECVLVEWLDAHREGTQPPA